MGKLFFCQTLNMFSLSVSLPQGISGESCSTREEKIYHLAIVSGFRHIVFDS